VNSFLNILIEIVLFGFFLLVPTYVKTLIDLFTDNSLNEEIFESIIIQHKIKYLK